MRDFSKVSVKGKNIYSVRQFRDSCVKNRVMNYFSRVLTNVVIKWMRIENCVSEIIKKENTCVFLWGLKETSKLIANC